MIAKGLAIASLLLFALVLSGCSPGPLFGRAEAPLIVVSSAPGAPQGTATPPPAETLPSEILGTLEEGTPPATSLTEEAPPTEIATSTALMKVPTPTPEKPKLEIQSSRIKLSEDGQKYLIEGQLFNGGKTTADLTNFKLIARLYDSYGRQLASALGRATAPALPPQSVTSFRISLDYIAGVDTYKLQGGY